MQNARSVLLITLASVFAAAQSPKAIISATHKPSAEPASAPTLPVTRVALYKNGVGFFEHSGQVTGSQSVTIDFTTAQLNDVLQSLTAIDLNGGRIAGAGYNSTTPLEQQLKALPLALGLDPTAVDFYNAIRGARVEVRSGAITAIGRLLNIEVLESAANNDRIAQEKRIVTVIGETGDIRTVELTPTTEVRLLDAGLHQDVTRYLQLLASTRNQGLRHLTLADNAPDSSKTPRELRVSYISEVPIWKSTYRILVTSPSKTTTTLATQSATMQGWSVVDNTTGSDWKNVHLSLIAGAPQSFIQPLSQPIYSRRPEIPIAQQAQLTPQTHESGETATLMAEVHGMAGVGASAGGVLGGVMGGIGNGPGSGGNYGGGAKRIGSGVAALSTDSVDLIAENQSLGASFQSAAGASLSPNTTTAAFDDYFAYNLTDPITIRKNESALVPILQTKIDAERVTLASFTNNARQTTPLRALWITNTSALTLDRGSFSIIEDGNFGGEGLLDPIHPAEKRLLSYAVDQAVHVTTESNSNSSHITEITAARGVLAIKRNQVIEITYVVHNAAPESRMVIVEHTIHQGYTLNSDPKPAETTPTLYRYRVATDAGATVRLHVGERHPTSTTYQLTRSDDNQLAVILNQADHNPQLESALQPILAARRHQADMQAALDNVNARLTDLRSDEERQRANVAALTNADKTARERFVHDLNATEDQINAAQKQFTLAQANVRSAMDDLANKIEALQFDEKL